MDVIIRKVEFEDLESIVDLQFEGWREAYKNIIDKDTLDNLDRESKIKKRQKDYKENGFLVAEFNNQIVGYVRYVDNNSFSKEIEDIDCELLALYVKANLKYNGIGTKLFNYVLDEFKEKNKTKMILWCLKENEPSKKFYEKMGGKNTYERTINIGGKDYQEDGFIYELK